MRTQNCPVFVDRELIICGLTATQTQSGLLPLLRNPQASQLFYDPGWLRMKEGGCGPKPVRFFSSAA